MTERAPAPAESSAPEIRSVKLEVVEGPASAKPSGVLDSLKNLFNGRPAENPKTETPADPVSVSPAEQSPVSSPEPLTGEMPAVDPTPSAVILPAEIEAKLSVIPDTREPEMPAADPGAAAGADPADEALTADDVRGMLDSVVIEDEDIRDFLEEGFLAIAEYTGHDHWKLTPRQLKLMGKPLAKLFNSLWTKLCLWLPEYVARWCEETPGLAGVIVASGLVLGPKVVKELRLRRAERLAPVVVKPVAALEVPPAVTKKPAAPAVAFSKEVIAPAGVC